MKDNRKTPFENFEDFARGIVNVPRAEVQKKLAEEKQKKLKKRKPKANNASPSAND